MKRLAIVAALFGAVAFCSAESPNTIAYWVTQSNIIPGYATQMAGAAVVGDYLYILGGNNSVDGDTGRVWRLKIDAATGALSDCTAMTTLPAMNNFAYISEQVEATASGIYVVGGGYNLTGPNRNNVCSIGVDANGNFTAGSWSQSPALPGGYDPELGSAVIASNGYLYAMAGDSESGTPPLYDVCVYAPVSANGGLGAFSTGTTLPSACYFSANAAVGNYIVLHRGLLTKGVNTSVTTNVYLAQVNNDGTMGSWVEQTAAALPAGRYGVAMIAVEDTVFVLGGRASGGTPQNNVWRAQLSGGALGAWQSSDAQLPDGVRYHAAVYSPVSKSIYVVSIRRASDGAVSNEAYISSPLFPRTVSAAASDWSLFE
ncbi:MAG: hypothetical protein D6691_04880 [Candidatus Hydrogenedentota bacterium]|nr:MAG: hypothetical protein D6691_04880 [Candidatus Hydrogenedentota bacterium]GIX45675.1 MAG: hypothetical protein KatS3mg130_2083 [Candidatus Sumerlaea sp.]